MATKAQSHPTAERWTIQRKADVLAAIIYGGLSLEDARQRYRLTPEELGEWWRLSAVQRLLG